MLTAAQLDGEVTAVATSVQQVPPRRNLTGLPDRVQESPPRGPYPLGRVDNLNGPTAPFQEIEELGYGGRWFLGGGQAQHSAHRPDRRSLVPRRPRQPSLERGGAAPCRR
jgi:hypothetical protein